MNSFLKSLFILTGILISSNPSIVFAATDPSAVWDHGLFHVTRYTLDAPIQSLGIVGGHLLATTAPDQHFWYTDNEFIPVRGTDPAKALGYPIRTPSETLLSVPEKSPCSVFKDAVSGVSVTDTQTLCLRSTPGGDFTLDLSPVIAGTKKALSVGFGKQPVLEKTKLTWIGYDGNLYMAFLHPSYFQSSVSAMKTKTNPAVFLLRNGVKFSIPNEHTYYSWFDSFKTVSLFDAKKVASYPFMGNVSYRANTLVKFKDDSTVYVYQPVNDPYVTFGKDVKIIEEKKDRWIVQTVKTKTPVEFLKRPELLRPIAAESVAADLYGPDWTKRIIELDSNQQSQFATTEKSFNVLTDLIVE